jgi:hypothetical protein
MNGKRAKAIRRLNAALEQEALAFQQMIRQSMQEPTKTMSMDDFNKARVKAGGIGVLTTTPRTPDVDPEALAVEMDRANAIEQEVKIGLLVQNSKHYIPSDEMAIPREVAFKLTDMHGDRGVCVEVWPDDKMPVDVAAPKAEIIILG